MKAGLLFLKYLRMFIAVTLGTSVTYIISIDIGVVFCYNTIDSVVITGAGSQNEKS